MCVCANLFSLGYLACQERANQFDQSFTFTKAAKKLKKRGVRCGMIDADLSVNLGATARNNVTSAPADFYEWT